MIGQVKSYDSKKRYGYISSDDGRQYFVHESEICIPSKCLSAGYTVTFIPSSGSPYPRATSVKLL